MTGGCAHQAYKHCYLHSSADTFALSPANYVINDEFKFIYFEIPKVASTAIRTLIHKVGLVGWFVVVRVRVRVRSRNSAACMVGIGYRV